MPLFFSKKQPETINTHLHRSFHNVRKDTQVMFHYLHHLFQKHQYTDETLKILQHQQKKQNDLLIKFDERNQQQEQLINDLKSELKQIPKSKEELLKMIKEITSYDDIINKIDSIKDHLHEVRKNHSDLLKSHLELQAKPLSPPKVSVQKPQQARPQETVLGSENVDILSKRIERLEEKRQNVKEKIISRIVKNTKGYIKNIIMSYIKKYNTIAALQLKEMIVHEQGLCSKSTFYRLLEELEQEADIGVIKEGKEKKYIAKVPIQASIKSKKKKR